MEMKRWLFIFDFVKLPQIVMQHKSLLWQFVKRNIAVRYRGSMLGLVWSFVQPLLMLCVYTFVFSVVFKARWGVDTGESKAAFAIIMFCGCGSMDMGIRGDFDFLGKHYFRQAARKIPLFTLTPLISDELPWNS